MAIYKTQRRGEEKKIHNLRLNINKKTETKSQNNQLCNPFPPTF